MFTLADMQAIDKPFVLSDNKVEVQVHAPRSAVTGVVAYLSIDTSALPKELLALYSRSRLRTPTVHAVVFESRRIAGHLYMMFGDSPPVYESYLRSNGLYDEILDKIKSVAEVK